jgi:pyruvate dehydrogenase E2 component (dihydrolipoamide acetyltransferase)
VSTTEIRVPDLGGSTNVDVIEVQVAPGDVIEKEQTLITLEGDKATMDIPSPYAGKVQAIQVKVGDKVSKDSVILTLEATEAAKTEKPAAAPAPSKPAPEAPAKKPSPPPPTPPSKTEVVHDFSSVHAGPGVRRLAREFGIDLTKIQGSGNKQRILKEDLQAYVKNALAGQPQGGFSLPTAPVVDFSQFGSIETIALSRIKKLSASNLHRNWLLVPHVTQFDFADITELEAFRKEQIPQAEKQGIKLTPLAFILKATVSALKAFPTFNSSLDPSGEQLILKHYFHIGVAVDTPDGLVVPVIRNVDQKSVLELAKELAEMSQKARQKALTPNDMQGSSFSISSLGGIGGTAFTPIVNVPNVAILGVSRSNIQPVYMEGAFVPRLMLPLSVSYDHRVIDGAEGARFTTYLSKCLTDLKLSLL